VVLRCALGLGDNVETLNQSVVKGRWSGETAD